MWQKYKSQIIMAIVGAILTGTLGWLGKVGLDSYTHVNTAYHPTSEDMTTISNQLRQIDATVKANEFRLNQMRYDYLTKKNLEHGLDNFEKLELRDLERTLTGGAQ